MLEHVVANRWEVDDLYLCALRIDIWRYFGTDNSTIDAIERFRYATNSRAA